jgi:hypothetical protein
MAAGPSRLGCRTEPTVIDLTPRVDAGERDAISLAREISCRHAA